MNNDQLSTLREDYVNLIIDGMDMESLCQLAYDALSTTYEEYSEDEIKGEIVEFYGEETLNNLLSENNNQIKYNHSQK